MLDDPAPLYKALWNDGRPRASDVLTLGRCLCERAPVEPAWALRVASALARWRTRARRHTRSGAAAAARLRAGAQYSLEEIAVPMRRSNRFCCDCSGATG